MKHFFLLLLLSLLAIDITSAQSKPGPDTWKPLRYFVGTWVGTGKGEPGNSKLEREYRFILNNKFVEVKHRSTYAPQPKNPKGEVHDDLGFFSYDKARKQFIFRQFHVESFVIQYVVASISPDTKTLVFESENIETVPKGYRARETYKIISDNEFTETFELAGPGKEFQVYSENRFKRKN